MGRCYLCETESATGFFSYYCHKCNLIKRMISLYKLDRVYSILETVLVRTPQQQGYKISGELDTEANLLAETKIETKIEEKVLRSGKRVDLKNDLKRSC